MKFGQEAGREKTRCRTSIQGVHLISLGQYGNRGCAGVDPAAGFGGRHPLHSVNATLKLEAAIHALPADGGTGKFTAPLLLCRCYLHYLNSSCAPRKMCCSSNLRNTSVETGSHVPFRRLRHDLMRDHIRMSDNILVAVSGPSTMSATSTGCLVIPPSQKSTNLQ